MTTIKSVTNGNYTHTLSASVTSQNIAANTSTVSYSYVITRNVAAGSGAFATSPVNFGVTLNGVNDTEGHTFDFRTSSTLIATSGTRTVTHNTDGTKTISGAFTGPQSFVSSGMPETSGSGTLTLPTIPRASVPSFEVSGSPVTSIEAGSTVTIDTNRASSSFTHDISYAFGSASGSIDTSVGASTSWTPPLSLLTQIPNSTSGTASIVTDTLDSSGNLIGTTTVSLTIVAPITVIPTISSVSATENTTSPDVATLVGGFVQGISTLTLAMTGAAGVYGSTIVTRKLTIDGQTINASSGTTAPITATGTLLLTATVIDSRGRTGTKTTNVTILPYSPPIVNTFTARRATSGGTLDPNGTYLSVNLIAAVQSLVVGSQKNDLTYAFKQQSRGGTTPWASITPDATSDAHSTGISTTILPGTYSITSSYDVRMEVTDVLGTTTAVQGTVSTGGVLMNLSISYDGIGVGKYWTQGSVDALSQMYQNNGNAVLDNSSTYIATDAETISGTLSSKVTTPHGVNAALVAYVAGSGNLGSNSVTTAKIAANAVTVDKLADTGWTALGFANSYSAGSIAPAYRILAGVCYLRGDFYRSSAPTTRTTASTLPSGARPTAVIVLPVRSSASALDVQIDTSGNIGFMTTNAYTSGIGYILSGLSFPVT